MQHQPRKTFFEGSYETNIDALCRLAKMYQCYKEGDRDPLDGNPYGTSPYAIMAKFLWKFQSDKIHPLDLDPNEIPDLRQILEVFNEYYELKPGTDRSKDPTDFISEYILKKHI